MKQASRSLRPKTQYKVKNWSAYNKALKLRGSITLWIDKDSESKWYYKGPTQRGAQFVYSDDAIRIALTVRQVFHLAFRQTEGFMDSIIKLIHLNVTTPDYSVLCRRMKGLAVKVKTNKAVTDIVFDGTGLKLFGEGEWKVRQYGHSKRRSWRKLYIGMDIEGKQVQVVDVTPNSVHDCDTVPQMLGRIETPSLKRFYGDGGFDKWKVYETLKKFKVEPIIPPQKNAKIKQHGNRTGKPLARDNTIRLIRKHGRKKWKEMTGYHKRSLVENFFFRYKTIIGDHLKSRLTENQKTEADLNINILNKMLKIGAPITQAIK